MERQADSSPTLAGDQNGGTLKKACPQVIKRLVGLRERVARDMDADGHRAHEVEKLDTETTMNNAQLQAYGYRTQATNYTAESGLDTMKATDALKGAGYAATGAELSADAGILATASATGSQFATGWNPG